MEEAYANFAIDLKNRELSDNEFVTACIALVSHRYFNQDPTVMISAVICHLFPSMRILSGDMLTKSNIIPCSNISEAFNYVRSFGVIEEDGALFHEQDGTLNFSLRLSGLKKIAEHEPKMKSLLDHVDLVFVARDIYKS